MSCISVSQASATDMTDLDKAYSLDSPRDPDRAIYKMMFKYDPKSVFVLRKNGKIVCSAYCFAFPTGSSCIGGIFLDKNKGNATYVLDIIHRCLQHLNARGSCFVFSSVGSGRVEDLGTFKKAGFVEVYRRSVGVKKKGTLLPSPTKAEMLSDLSDIKKAITYLTNKEKIQRNTFSMFFWPQMFSEESIEYLLKLKNLLVVVNENKDSIVVSHRIFTEYQEGRWFITPMDITKNQPNARVAGEIMLLLGEEALTPLSQSLRLLDSQGVSRIYCYDYEKPAISKNYEQLGFSFQQPQIILSRKVNASWSVSQESGHNASILDNYLHM